MKVKLFSSSLGLGHLEKQINYFINGVEVIDIKIQTSDKITVALVIYKEGF